ncbi:MAG: DUF1540 domain-containing protein [Halanaerobiales bacterium]|nr:DUF1540 domain-containing protein [Halanaerobiales bacterium]
MSKIKCSVDNCQFYGSGNICKANAIEVAKNFKSGHDLEAGVLGKGSTSSNETKCVTFKLMNH